MAENSPGDGRKVLMLLSNAFEPDPRVYKEAKSLLRAGYAIEVLAWDREGRYPAAERIDGIPVRRIQTPGAYGDALRAMRGFFGFYRAALRHIRQVRPGVVHCHDLDTAPLGWLAQRRLPALRFIYDAHEPEYYLYFPRLLKKMFDRLEIGLARAADAVIVTNLLQVEKFTRHRIRRLALVRNVPEREAVARAARRAGPGEAQIIGRIGQITDHLGLETLCAVLNRLRSRFPGVKLQLVGRVHPGFAPRFQGLREQYADFLEYIGFVRYPEAMSYYRRFTIAYMLYDPHSYYRYGTPTKMFEAMAFGVPGLLSPIGDVEAILRSHPCGLQVPTLAATDIESALTRLLSDAGLRRAFSANGRRAFHSEFNWEKMEDALLSCYSQGPMTTEKTFSQA